MSELKWQDTYKWDTITDPPKNNGGLEVDGVKKKKEIRKIKVRMRGHLLGNKMVVNCFPNGLICSY